MMKVAEMIRELPDDIFSYPLNKGIFDPQATAYFTSANFSGEIDGPLLLHKLLNDSFQTFAISSADLPSI